MSRPSGTVRRALLAVLALVAAVGVASWYLTAGSRPDADDGDAARVASSAATDAAKARAARDPSAPSPRRPRIRAAADASGGSGEPRTLPTGASDAVAAGGVGALPGTSAPGGAPPQPDGTGQTVPPDISSVIDRIAQAMAENLVVGLPATPARDPATGEAPVVAPGRPPEMALASFVERGAAAVERTVELVGERRPVVEDGVPVSLTGRVVEAEGGAPIVGARLVVSSTFYVRRYFYDHHLTEVASVATAADGTFAIERLNVDPAHFGSGGRLYLTVTADERAPALAVPLVNVSPGVANRLPDVALRRAVRTLSGRVLDQWEGRPVVGARVVATGQVSPVSYPKDERPALLVGAPATVTDADGRFTLSGLGDGLQTISVHAGDDCIGWTVAMLPHPGEFEMRTRQIRGRIEGTCVGPRGEPIDVVTIMCDDNSTHSFADGRFALENFRGDAATVRFTHPDYAPVTLADVRDGTAGLVVRMDRQPIEVVLDVRARETNAPVRRVRVEFMFADGAERPARTSPERIAANGRHRVRIPSGATAATVTADGRDPEIIAVVNRAAGDVIDVFLAAAAGK